MNIKDLPEFYDTVYKHLTKTREWSHELALLWLTNSPWRLVLRVNNLLARRNIIARHNHSERRADGSVWVSDTRTLSSLVLLRSGS